LRHAPVEPPLDRASLATVSTILLQRGGTRSADVLLVERGGQRIVVKDFGRRPRWLRETLGRWLVRRELRAYRALAGHRFVPKLIGRVDAHAFAIEYRPGRRLSRRLVGSLPPRFLDHLEEAVRGMHASGVVHLDLRHRSNVLVDERGEPVLIDFASALCLRNDRAMGRALHRLLARLDRRALEKWRAKLQPG
jgi:predicted Ser/Thr protein kinase